MNLVRPIGWKGGRERAKESFTVGKEKRNLTEQQSGLRNEKIW